MLPCMPVTWKNGSTARRTVSGFMLNQYSPAMRVCIAVRWLCMQPFGWPVVPEVYGMTQRSSGPAVIGPGRRLRARTSDHSVTPASPMAWRGAATNSGTFRSVGRFR